VIQKNRIRSRKYLQNTASDKINNAFLAAYWRGGGGVFLTLAQKIETFQKTDRDRNRSGF
jgi:hypothetical protein